MYVCNRMKKYLILLCVLCVHIYNVSAQVSHGGRPLPLSMLRSANEELFKEMPSFDVAEELRIDSLCESDLRSGRRFAYKFMTDYNRDNSGINFTLPDGTKVWRLGIHSKDARSINLLFSEYELPEGAQLFLYDSEQTQILGAFNHLNNSDLHILPTAPVQGDRLIIEYQEPAHAKFRGRLTVGEVNHAYRDFRGSEPQEDVNDIACIPALACDQDHTNNLEAVGRSVVLLIIDGNISCSGVLVNNTTEDGKPYLLTASHCLNKNFTIQNPDYAQIAGTIVSFFNYDSPLCQPKIRGTEEMSVASARFRAVNEPHDMMLLELLEVPPVYYRPYYAGWNIRDLGLPPYACIQHPKTGTKAFSIEEDNVSYQTMISENRTFSKDAHIHVKHWETGCTADGSSGSPLFDSNRAVIGLLSGGQSICDQPINDFFYSMKKVWDDSDKADEQLKHWLDPADTKAHVCQGIEPYSSSPCIRLSNIRLNGHAEDVETAITQTDKEPLFGNNSLGVNEYAESYQSMGPARLYGAYFVTPPAGTGYRNLHVKVTVYEGEHQPERILHSEIFQPSYCNKHVYKDTFLETRKSLNRAQESYIHFSEPVEVNGNFFIGYQIESAPQNTYFSAYNLPKGASSRNTTWVYDHTRWVEASDYSHALFSTSLFIDPVIQYTNTTSNQSPEPSPDVRIMQGADRKEIHILLPDGVNGGRFSLISTEGKLLRSGLLNDRQTTLRIGEYPSGIYFVQLLFDNKSFIQKVIL